MIVLVFTLAVILPSGEFQVHSGVVEDCPEKAAFTAKMDAAQANKEILGWYASCDGYDKNIMMSKPS